MNKSLSQQWYDVWTELWRLECIVEKLIKQGPDKLYDQHYSAMRDVRFMSASAYELLQAIRAWEDDRQQLDDCTEGLIDELRLSKMQDGTAGE